MGEAGTPVRASRTSPLGVISTALSHGGAPLEEVDCP